MDTAATIVDVDIAVHVVEFVVLVLVIARVRFLPFAEELVDECLLLSGRFLEDEAVGVGQFAVGIGQRPFPRGLVVGDVDGVARDGVVQRAFVAHQQGTDVLLPSIR